MLRKVPGYRMHLYLCLSNDSALMDECCVHTDERPVLGDTSSSSRRGHMPQYAVLRKRVYDAYAAEQRGLPQRHAFDQELQRRKMALFLYLIRSPIFDRCVAIACFDTCSLCGCMRCQCVCFRMNCIDLLGACGRDWPHSVL
jgi:hypothetical protein